jgi:ATP-dependent Clp protease ATP-binding subunit ClpC
MYDSYRFDGFTEQARKVFNLAEAECQRFQHRFIGTEHLLLGLVAEGDGIAAKILANLGVELENARDQTEDLLGRGNHTIEGEIPLSPRVKKVIEQARDDAHRLGHHSLGTEHLLLALVHDGEGLAIHVLEGLGINREQVQTQTFQMLQQVTRPHA